MSTVVEFVQGDHEVLELLIKLHDEDREQITELLKTAAAACGARSGDRRIALGPSCGISGTTGHVNHRSHLLVTGGKKKGLSTERMSRRKFAESQTLKSEKNVVVFSTRLFPECLGDIRFACFG